ncbi:hypothetical protein N9427_01010 [Paracoccaceae bacterium]|nr:hypothetical protein [Paracoccaceae bacterium]
MMKRIIIAANFPQVEILSSIIESSFVDKICLITNVRENPVLERISKSEKILEIWDYFETQNSCPDGDTDSVEISTESYNRVAHLILIALDMLDRNDHKIFSKYKSRRDLVYKLIGYCLGIFKKHDINLLIFNSTPHTIFHFCLYIASEIQNVQRLMFYRFPIVEGIEPSYYCYTDLLNHRESMIKHEPSDRLIEYFNKKSELFNLSFTGTTKPTKITIKRKLTYLRKELSKVWTPQMGFSGLSFALRKHLKDKTANYSLPVANVSCEYVFFPLHFQPECSTNPLGGRFRDQIAAIRFLQKKLDKKYQIIIKPHPRQSTITLNYKEIIDQRTKLAPSHISTCNLVQNSQGVAVITGTTGFFAAINGIPVICFGHIFFEDFSNVLKIRNENDGDKINTFLKTKTKNNKDVQNHLLSLSKFSIYGARDNRYIENQNINVQENNSLYYNFIKKFIEN